MKDVTSTSETVLTQVRKSYPNRQVLDMASRSAPVCYVALPSNRVPSREVVFSGVDSLRWLCTPL